MWQNCSNRRIEPSKNQSNQVGRKVFMSLALLGWVFICLVAAEALIYGLVILLKSLHVPISSLNQSVLSTILSTIYYIIAFGLTVSIPWLTKKHRTAKIDIGLSRLPSWTDILVAPAGLIIYMILSAILVLGLTHIFPWINTNQTQETGFSQMGQHYEYILAFVTLVVITPLAEEILFRGYLFGKLKKFIPVWLAILATSLLFGIAHWSWTLGIDTFALSIVLCLLRETTGSIWSSVLLHMIKNGIAYYILFINPLLSVTLLK
jgi:membrane protease YdiL (CAAX protease family)